MAGGRTPPLGPDPLLFLVAAGRVPLFRGFPGRLNPSGYGRAQASWPADPRLRGLTLHAAAITLQAGYPGACAA